MKKIWLFFSLLLCCFFITWCFNKIENTNETQTITNKNTDQIISDAIYQYEECGKDSENEKTFISYALLWTWWNSQWHTEYYLVVNGQWYFLDQRWNIASSCGFGGIPTTISISQDENWPVLQEYKIARDGSEYDSSTREMFSKQAYNTRRNWKYTFNNTEKTFLEQAEEYFGTTVIPESENNFDCPFCDKLRYYDWDPEDDEKLQDSNDLIFNYVSNNNGKNTIYFGSDWSFEAKWSWDEWTWIRVFGKDKNTIIVSSNRADHIYNRYIITNQDENNLNTILEVIQSK